MSYPEERTFICQQFCKLIRQKYPDTEVIAGVATGAIAHGMLVAQELGLPFIYVRPKPKDHGLENLIEGDIRVGQKVVIIEDLISTGLSSLKAADAIINFGGEVLGMLAIFTYNFPLAHQNFADAGLELTTLSQYQVLIEQALEKGDVKAEDMEKLNKWREQPDTWGK
jgi:orotate phosphoribosyltransferase